MQIFQHALTSKHPQYYSTMRLGRSLKDRCTKNDPERDVINQMLEQLKNKWNIVRSIVAQRFVVTSLRHIVTPFAASFITTYSLTHAQSSHVTSVQRTTHN